MSPELTQALLGFGVVFLGLLSAIGLGLTVVIRASFNRKAAKIETDGKWEREQLEQKLNAQARQRQLVYDERVNELAEKADMRAALDRQSENLTNLVNAMIDFAKNDGKKTEVLAAHTTVISANTQTIEIFGDKMEQLAQMGLNTAENMSATRKAAETAIADHAIIIARMNTLEARISNVIALFTPVPSIEKTAGTESEAAA